MDHLSSLASGAWGVAGAFIYAAPRLTACLITCRDAGKKPWLCVGELAIALVTGGIGAAAFSPIVMGLARIHDANAIAALIGLLANPLAPKIIGASGVVLASIIESPLGRALKGPEKP